MKMNKIVFILAGMLVSSMTYAASQTLDTTRNNVLAENVSLLNEDVEIRLSDNVLGAIAYNTTLIAIATCHEGGRTVARNVQTTDAQTGETTTEEKTGAEMPTATTLQGTVIKEYPETTCDETGTNVTSHAESKLTQ